MPMTIVGLGHRPSLRKFHDQVLTLGPKNDSEAVLSRMAPVPKASNPDDDREEMHR
jgi:ABC-type uncharacterized transport system fused permease/ATPase subunit